MIGVTIISEIIATKFNILLKFILILLPSWCTLYSNVTYALKTYVSDMIITF